MSLVRHVIVLSAAVLAACHAEPGPATTVEVVATLPGAEPAPPPPGTGTAAVTGPAAAAGSAAPLTPAERAAFRKTVDALLRAISRSAVMGFEREHVDPADPTRALHRLCKSAVPVPATVPRAVSHVPRKGADFDVGDPLTGWPCLKFVVADRLSVPCQLTYAAGGAYKGPKRGGPDPGTDGFEAAAECDQDGDGKTSLFTVIGTFDAAQDAIVLGKEAFTSDEEE